MYQDLGWVPIEPSALALPPIVDAENGLKGQELHIIADPDGLFSEGGSDALEIGEAELASLASLAPETDLDPADPSYMPPEGGGDGDDIIVIGQRVTSSPYSYLYWWYNAPDDQTTTNGDGSVPGVITSSRKFGNPPTVESEVINSANAAAVNAEANKLMQGVIDLTVTIDSLPDFQSVQLADGTTMTALDLKKLWATIDFKVTDAAPQPGRAGGYDNPTRTATFFLRDDSGRLTISGWAASDTQGLSFIMLHEVAHSSPEGVKETEEQWERYRAANRDRSESWLEENYWASTQFEENEEFANIGARALAVEMGIPPSQTFDPTNGYEYGIPDND